MKTFHPKIFVGPMKMFFFIALQALLKKKLFASSQQHF